MTDAHDNFRLFRGYTSGRAPVEVHDVSEQIIPDNRVQIHENGKLSFTFNETGANPNNVLIVCMDVSGSMESYFDKLREIGVYIAEETQKASIPEGFVNIIYFSDRINGIVDAAADDAIQTISNMAFSGGTDFIKPLNECSRIVRNLAAQTVTIKFLTDGECGGWASANSNLQRELAKTREAVLEPIYFSYGYRSASMKISDMRFNCTKVTDFSNIADLKENLESSILSMGSQYTVQIDGIGSAQAFSNGETVVGVFGIVDQIPEAGSSVRAVLTGGSTPKNYVLTVVNAPEQVSVDQTQLLASLLNDYTDISKAGRVVEEVERLRNQLPESTKAVVSEFLRRAASGVLVENTISVQKGFSIHLLMRKVVWNATQTHGSRVERKARRAVDRLAELVAKHRNATSNAIANCERVRDAAFQPNDEIDIAGAPDDIITMDTCKGPIVCVLSGLGIAIQQGDDENPLLLSATQAPHGTRAHLTAVMSMESFASCINSGLSIINTQMLGVPSVPTRGARTEDQQIWVQNVMKIFPMMLLSGIPMLGGSARAMDAFAAAAWSLLQNPADKTRVAAGMVLTNYYGERIKDPALSLKRMIQINGIALSNAKEGDGLIPTPAVALIQSASLVLNGTYPEMPAPIAAIFECLRQWITQIDNIAEVREDIGNALVEGCMEMSTRIHIDLVEMGRATEQEAATLYGKFADLLQPQYALINIDDAVDQAKAFLERLTSFSPVESCDPYLQPARTTVSELLQTYTILERLVDHDIVQKADHQFGWWDVPDFHADVDNLDVHSFMWNFDAVLMSMILLVTEGRTSDIRNLGDVNIGFDSFAEHIPGLLKSAGTSGYKAMHNKAIQIAVERLAQNPNPDQIPGVIRLCQFSRHYEFIAGLITTSEALEVVSNDAFVANSEVRNAYLTTMASYTHTDYFGKMDSALLRDERVVQILRDRHVSNQDINARLKTPEKLPSSPNSATFNRNFRRALARTLGMRIPRKGTVEVEDIIQSRLGHVATTAVMFAPGYKNASPDADFKIEITPQAAQGTLFETHKAEWCFFLRENHGSLVVREVHMPTISYDRGNNDVTCTIGWDNKFEEMIDAYKTSFMCH